MHAFLGELHRQIGPGWRPWLLFLAPLLVVALVLTLPPLLQPRTSQAVGDILSVTMANSPDGPWYPADLEALVPPDDYGWVRVIVAIPSAAAGENAEPLGLFLSGSFSAKAYWNGTLVGEKGIPGATKQAETPGPVDRVLFVDRALPKAGNNTLLLEMSSHYRPANTFTVIHGSEEIFGVRVAPYSAEARRSINYYIVPLLAAVLLTIALVVLIWRYRGRWHAGAISVLLANILLVSILLMAVCAELFRSFYDYPYQYHGYRIGVIRYSLLIFFILLPIQAFVSQFKNFQFKQHYKTVLGLLAIGLILSLANVNYSAWLSLLAIFSSCWYWHGANKKLQWANPDIKLLLGLFSLLVVSSLFGDERIFEDRYLYAAILPWLAAVVFVHPLGLYGERKDQGAQEKIVKDKLSIRTAGKQRLIAIAEIVAISGAGNYTEIYLADDSKVLDDRTLKNLEKELPAGFMRVHRSHIVNLDFIRDLQSEGGGKYTIGMVNKSEFPVSRHQINKLRDVINQRVLLAN